MKILHRIMDASWQVGLSSAHQLRPFVAVVIIIIIIIIIIKILQHSGN